MVRPHLTPLIHRIENIVVLLSHNTYFWSPGRDSGSRRRSEEKRQQEVADFLKQLGFTVSRDGNDVNAALDNLEVYFHYHETCGNVYKSLAVRRGGKNSNISSLRKLYAGK